MDYGIAAVVVGLRLHGLNTYASCEGHRDRHGHFPWVALSTPEARELLCGPCNGMSGGIEVSEALQATLSDINRPLFRSTVELVQEFNTGRNVRSPAARIVAVDTGTDVRVLPDHEIHSGTDYGSVRRLAAYQREFDAFGEFLMQRFLDPQQSDSNQLRLFIQHDNRKPNQKLDASTHS